jgi:hypothetical protein
MVSLLVLLLSLPSIASAKNSPQKDFDLACAVAAGAALRTMPNFKETGFTIYIFFLGRLSGREDGPDWSTIVADRVTDTKGKEPSASVLDACVKFFAAKTK